VADTDQIFGNLPPRFTGRVRADKAARGPTPENAPIAAPPQSSGSSVYDAAMTPLRAAAGAAGRLYDWGTDKIGQSAYTPFPGLAPSFHPVSQDTADWFTEAARNPPMPMGPGGSASHLMSHLAEASLAAPLAMAAAPAARTGRAITDVASDIRRLPVDQGIAQARTEAHLIPNGGGSVADATNGFVGAPPDIKTYADLQARRASVDNYIAQRLEGSTWYDRGRAGIAQATGGDPQAADWWAKLHGMTSAGVSPEAETQFALKEAVSRAAGEPAVGHYGAQSRSLDRAIEANDPDLMQQGGKTSEYAAKLAQDQPYPTATGVNDFRQFKLWQYPQADNPATRNFGEAQHRFMDYETALSAARANDIGLGGRTNWTGEQIQAVPWVTQKAEDLGIPFEDAAKTGADFYTKHQAAVTYEQQPGQALVDRGHLPGADKMSAEDRAVFAANDPWTDATGRDVIYGGGRVYNSAGERTGLGVPTLPTVSATGVWKDETNPARIARPAMPFTIGGQEGLPKDTKSVPGFGQNLLNTGEYIRSLFGAQEGGGWNKLWGKQAPGAQNAVFVPLDRDITKPEIDALSKAGEQFGLPNVTSTNGGVAVLNYDGAPKLKPKDRDGLMAAIGDAKPDDAGDHRMVRADTGYAGPEYTEPGSFSATEALFGPKYMGRNPGLNDFFANNAGIGQSAGALARRDLGFEGQLGAQGQDFWNLRNLAAADPSPELGMTWADRLQQAVRSRAVPASVTVGGVTTALYPTAGLPAPLQQPQRPGTTLNSQPDWQPDWQLYGGGF